MKKVDIIYFGDIRDVNGVNIVNNHLLLGKRYFEKNGIILNKIYNDYSIINCSEKESLPIGINIETLKYKTIRKIRGLLKKILSSKIPIFAWFKINQNLLLPAKKVIEKYAEDFNSEFIIFQDIFTAYYYFSGTIVNRKKTVLILHCGKHPFDQLELNYPSIKNRRYQDKLNHIKNIVFENIDRIVYLSQKARDANHFYKEKISYIYNGIPDVDILEYNNENDKINFVCVGTMNYVKGHEVIIKAVKLISTAVQNKMKVYFIGDGPQASELKEMVEEYKLNDIIEFIGLRNDVAKLLQKMDVFLLPSKTEGLPLSIIEALRQGLYVIATDVGGISEMISKEFGQLIERNELQLKEAIEKVIIENRIDAHSKEAARLHYENHFTLERMINSYSKLLLSIN